MERIPAEWLPRYTYNDYQQWEGHWELIRGFPVAMSPSPKVAHQRLAKKLVRMLDDALGVQPDSCDCEVLYELDWIVNDHTVVRPDILIACGKLKDDYIRITPSLIIEITSGQTRLNDPNVKFRLYEEQGVFNYLLFDPERRYMEFFRLQNNQYVSHQDVVFKLSDHCHLELNFADVW